jgi:hypothetical protein
MHTGFLVGSTSRPKTGSLPVKSSSAFKVERFAKESDFDQQSLVGRSRKSSVSAQEDQTSAQPVFQLSGASLISVVESPDLWNRYHAPPFRRSTARCSGVFAQCVRS